MEQSQNGVASYHRKSPSDRFLTVFSPPSNSPSIISTSPSNSIELNEDEVFYTATSSPSPPPHLPPTPTPPPSFRNPPSGILAALSETNTLHKPISSSPTNTYSRDIRTIPKPMYSQSMPMRKFQQSSAPMNVPIRARKVEVISDDEDGGVIMPPHEIVARGSLRDRNTTTFSVLEGVGRTLKGRDLRQVRNAVLRQTGFLD